MTFLQRNNGFTTKKKQSHTGSIVVVLVLIIIFCFSWSRNILFAVASPLWSGKNVVTNFFAANAAMLESKESLIAENNTLEAQLNQDEENTLLYQLIQEQNQDLKNILNRKDPSQQEVLAAVLTKPFLSPYDTLTIDVGTADGIGFGDKVVADGNVFIGTVSAVYDHSAVVTLYSSPGQNVNVLIGTSSIEEEATGMGGGNFSLSVPKQLAIAVGDPIVIPSISPNIFGTVGAINVTAADAVETVDFTLPVNIFELKWVEVMPFSNN